MSVVSGLSMCPGHCMDLSEDPRRLQLTLYNCGTEDEEFDGAYSKSGKLTSGYGTEDFVLDALCV